jgi:hypothetical protein
MKFVRQLGLCCFVAAAIIGAWSSPLDVAASRQVDAGFSRALASFATARALNAIISVAQGTDVSIEPAGVGVKLAPGQILHPVNELVGQFAELMLAASVAFGAMKVLIAIGGHWGVSVLLSAIAVVWLAFRLAERDAPGWLASALLLLLLARFAVPLATVASDAVFEQFLSKDYAASQTAIDGNAVQLASLSPPAKQADTETGIIERMKGWWSQNTDAVGSRLERLKQSAGQVTEHIIKLIVVFLMQTVVVPLLLLWGIYRIGKASLEPPSRMARPNLPALGDRRDAGP